MKLILILFSLIIEIKGKETGKPIEEVEVVINNKDIFLTDSMGICIIPESIKVETVELRKEGYRNKIIEKIEREKLNIYLLPLSYILPSQVVTAKEEEKEIGEKLTEKIPEIINDPLRNIEFFPSVTSIFEYMVYPVIRSEREVSVLWDGIPLFSFSHFLGIFGMLSKYQVKRVMVYPEPSGNPYDGLTGTISLNSKFPERNESKFDLDPVEILFYHSRKKDFPILISGRKSFVHKIFEFINLQGFNLVPRYEDFYINSSLNYKGFIFKPQIFYSGESFYLSGDTSLLGKYLYDFLKESKNTYLLKMNVIKRERNKELSLDLFYEENIGFINVGVYQFPKINSELKGIKYEYRNNFKFGFTFLSLKYDVEGNVEAEEFYLVPFRGSISLSSFYMSKSLKIYKSTYLGVFLNYVFNSYIKKWKPFYSLKLNFPLSPISTIQIGYGTSYFSLFHEVLSDPEFPCSKNYYICLINSFKNLYLKLTLYKRFISPFSFDILYYSPDDLAYYCNKVNEAYGFESLLSLNSFIGNFLFTLGIHNSKFYGPSFSTKSPFLIPFVINSIYISPSVKGFSFSLRTRYVYGHSYPEIKGVIEIPEENTVYYYFEGLKTFPPYFRTDVRIVKRFKNINVYFNILNILDRKNSGQILIFEENGWYKKSFLYYLPRIFSLGVEFSF